MRWLLPLLVLSGSAWSALPGPYAPPAGQAGSTAIAHNDERIRHWASGVSGVVRGPQDVSEPELGLADWGLPGDALGIADAVETEHFAVISLGDGGSITLTFSQPLGDGPGPDFAVFENSFSDDFLELAFVEVSSNGTTFHRFPAISLTQIDTQIPFDGLLDATYLHNLAGKYRGGFGTPFDLAELAGLEDLNIGHVTHVRIVDVVGSLDPAYRRLDSMGNPINDPWMTPFETSGFDLDAVAVLNIPEPGTLLCGVAGLLVLVTRRRRRA